ncbi:unnamed protein product [Leuciscus chuanchicus]
MTPAGLKTVLDFSHSGEVDRGETDEVLEACRGLGFRDSSECVVESFSSTDCKTTPQRTLFTPEREEAVCTTVVENNAIRLRQIKSAIIEDNNIFENIQTVSISTIEMNTPNEYEEAVHCST